MKRQGEYVGYTTPDGGTGFFAVERFVAAEETNLGAGPNLMKPFTAIRLEDGTILRATETPEEIVTRVCNIA